MISLYASNIITPYHLAGLNSFILSLGKDVQLEGEVFLNNEVWGKPLVGEAQLLGFPASIKVHNKDLKFSLFSLICACLLLVFRRSSKAKLFILGHSRVNLKLIAYLYEQGVIDWKTAFSTVIFDEGIGSYGGGVYRFKVFCKQASPSIMHSLAFIIVHPLNQVLLRLSFIIDHNWRLIRYTNLGGIQANELAVSNYRRYFESICEPNIQAQSKVVVLITQPLVEVGYMKEEDYWQCLRLLTEKVVNNGYQFFIKPHPIESRVRYECLEATLIDDSRPAECVLLELKPVLIFGMTSTAMINSKLILDMESYCINALFEGNEKLINVSGKDPFIRDIFNEYVNKVQSWEHLGGLLAANTEC